MKRKKVGLALGSGGWRGLAHIGVIKALVKNKIPIDFIAGCSVGALIGGFYSALGDTSKIEEIAKHTTFKDLRRLLFDFSRSSGLISGKRFLNFLENELGDVNIEDLKIPFAAGCADLVTAKSKTINKGPLSFAIRASISIPLIFDPVKLKNSYLIDGGIFAPIPVQIAKEMGADLVIGVNLYNNIFPFKKEYLKNNKLTKLSSLRIAYQMLLYNLALRDLQLADLVVNPKIWEGRFSIFSKFVKNEKLIELGEKATEEIIPSLKKILFS
jgi:NTE family protein